MNKSGMSNGQVFWDEALRGDFPFQEFLMACRKILHFDQFPVKPSFILG
jgi:hypothetical protein